MRARKIRTQPPAIPLVEKGHGESGERRPGGLWLGSLLAGSLFFSSSYAQETKIIMSMNHVIHQEKSLYRNILVMEEQGLRCLTFGRVNSRQTCQSLADPRRMVLDYTQAMLSALYAHPHPKRVLILGLGGGVLPMALRDLYPEMIIDTVEIDPAVITVAKNYFGYQEDEHSRAITSDGRVFVRNQRHQGAHYDMVFLDAFDKDYIPEHLLTREFFLEVRDLLSPDGLVVANTFSNSRLRIHETATYADVFGRVLSLTVSEGNRILLVGRETLATPDEIRQRAREASLPLEAMGVDANKIFSNLSEEKVNKDAWLLTDQYSPSNLL